MQFGRLIRTVRWLKRGQILNQVLFRLRKRLENPAHLTKLQPRFSQWHLREQVIVPQVWMPVPAQALEHLRERSFIFLNESRQIETLGNWEPTQASRLWTYNLHYFDWLWSCLEPSETGWEVAQALTSDWLASHLPCRNATGWEPYPSSLRLMNMCLVFIGVWRDRLSTTESFQKELIDSIWRQAWWLASHLEYHLLANHLLENAAALVVVGKCFAGMDAEHFRRQGNSLALREMREQILPDGMHYERSPMYHARICWLVEVLKEYGDESTSALAAELLPNMLDAMARCTHPDGQLALFNDAAMGIYSQPPVSTQAHGSWALSDSGYFGWSSREQDYLIIDCGEVGPNYQPGHAHADTLSFEWSIAGQRFITDTGTFEYKPGVHREYDRSTAAHNTVTVNGKNTSEVWSSFRVGSRCVPVVEKLELAEHEFHLTGCLKSNSWMHRRKFSYRNGTLLIDDLLDGRGSALIKCRFHFAPQVVVELLGENEAVCRIGDTSIKFICSGPDMRLSTEETRYSPQFGISLPRTSLCIECTVSRQTTWQSLFTVVK